MGLLESISIEKAINKPCTGITNKSTFIDMLGYEGCMFICALTTQSGSTGKMQLQQSSAQSTGAGIIQTTALTAVNPTSDSVQYIVIDAYKPMKRYLRLAMTDFSDSNFSSITAIKYMPTIAGTTEAKADVNASTLVVCTT